MEPIQSQTFVTVCGKRFHYIWLRDNCPCAECQDSNRFQRIHALDNVTLLVQPLSIEEKDGYLKIIWNEEPIHQSNFSVSWLLTHSYDPQPECINNHTILWDKAYLDQNPPKQYDVTTDNSKEWMNELFKLGFIHLKSQNFSDFKKFLLSIGPIYRTEDREIADVKPKEISRDISASIQGYALPPHVDGSYRYDGRLVQFIYCVENNAWGGESIVVDGFRVAEDFRENNPNYFDILSSTPVNFQQFDRISEYFFLHTAPLIELDKNGKIINICFSHKTLNVSLPFEKMESFYEAYINFFDYLKKPVYQHRFRLQSGDCYMVENFRVLHGRKKFDATIGERHLKVGYMNWHFFHGKHLFYKAKSLYSNGVIDE
ncbi:TauD/TfdA family dioxygenase [Microcoleus sp. D3_18a_C4]|uniref:TauD/TfdA family dioxygenase n=1 Tax=Microcoleus sp. D3_18a_C4 TaxID=3055332 RepID=UPI002FD268A9